MKNLIAVSCLMAASAMVQASPFFFNSSNDVEEHSETLSSERCNAVLEMTSNDVMVDMNVQARRDYFHSLHYDLRWETLSSDRKAGIRASFSGIGIDFSGSDSRVQQSLDEFFEEHEYQRTELGYDISFINRANSDALIAWDSCMRASGSLRMDIDNPVSAINFGYSITNVENSDSMRVDSVTIWSDESITDEPAISCFYSTEDVTHRPIDESTQIPLPRTVPVHINCQRHLVPTYVDGNLVEVYPEGGIRINTSNVQHAQLPIRFTRINNFEITDSRAEAIEARLDELEVPVAESWAVGRQFNFNNRFYWDTQNDEPFPFGNSIFTETNTSQNEGIVIHSDHFELSEMYKGRNVLLNVGVGLYNANGPVHKSYKLQQHQSDGSWKTVGVSATYSSNYARNRTSAVTTKVKIDDTSESRMFRLKAKSNSYKRLPNVTNYFVNVSG